MLLYKELGRHTPPPPPYSQSKRDTTNIKSTNEASQRPVPPPPPPYLNSTPKPNCTIPSIDELQRQAVASDDSYFFPNSNAIPFTPVPLQCSTAQIFDSQQGFGDSPGSWKYNSSYHGVPARPVEPKWSPVGIPGYPVPPLGGATAPLQSNPLGGLGHSVPQSFFFSAGTRIRPFHEILTSQSPSTVSLGQNAISYATQPLIHTPAVATTMDQKPLPTPRKQSSKDIASLANIVTTDVTASFEPSENMYQLSASPIQQTIEMTAVPTSQELNAVEKASNGKNPQCANEMNSSTGDPISVESISDKDGDSSAATVPKSQDHASPAGSKHDPQPTKECMQSQSGDGGRRVSHCSQRKASASARFEPYKRRQSKAVENMKQSLGGAVDEECAKSPDMHSEVAIDEDEKKSD